MRLQFIELLPALARRWAHEQVVRQFVVGDLFLLAVKHEFATKPLGDDAEQEDLRKWAGDFEWRTCFLFAFDAENEVLVVVRVFPRDLGKFIRHVLHFGFGNNAQRVAVRAAFENEVFGVDDFAVRLDLPTFFQLSRTRWKIVYSIIPCDFDRRHFATFWKIKLDGGCLREDEFIGSIPVHGSDFFWQSKIEELVHGVEDVRTPVTKGSVSVIEPTPPVSRVEFLIEIMRWCGPKPGIPIHSFRNFAAGGITSNLPTVPPPFAVHVSGHFGDILDDACLSPSFELEIVGPGMPLVSHLADDFVFLLGGHHQLTFLEGVGEWFFHIDVDAEGHGQHGDGEMRMIWHGNRAGINLLGHLVEHFAEVGELRNVRKHRFDFLRVFCAELHIAQRDDIDQARVVDCLGIVGPLGTAADEGNIDLAVGSDGSSGKDGISGACRDKFAEVPAGEIVHVLEVE